MLLAAVLAGGLALSAAAPGPARAAASPAGHPTTLVVFAAASLADAFQDLGRIFEARFPGIQVRFNFAGSQQLAAGLDNGARAGVFASADQRWMAHAVAAGLVEGQPGRFARNRLVVIVPRSNPARLGRLQDLARRGVKLVMAAAPVPAGTYGRQMLTRLGRAAGFPPDFQRRALANLASEEENVKQVVAKVELGEADAGVVYRSDVNAAVARRVAILEIPDSCNVLATYPIAVLKGGPEPGAAREFVRLVLSPEGQAILKSRGFLPAGDPGE
ncbi:MAG TPA: molybdate ABC transporter substrate-binding protein [Candidatus Saccharimonadales bacterium]|nr:molybdate ABC transporter substrate-binding protein [Candidatus Saccharimonadales bacterium]